MFTTLQHVDYVTTCWLCYKMLITLQNVDYVTACWLRYSMLIMCVTRCCFQLTGEPVADLARAVGRRVGGGKLISRLRISSFYRWMQWCVVFQYRRTLWCLSFLDYIRRWLANGYICVVFVRYSWHFSACPRYAITTDLSWLTPPALRQWIFQINHARHRSETVQVVLRSVVFIVIRRS